MNVFNLNMFQDILKRLSAGKKIEDTLFETLQDGFIEVNGCYFLKKLAVSLSHIDTADFIDKTGHECFINSLHVDDFVSNDFFVQAILFTDKLVSDWNKLNNDLDLEVILSETDSGFNIKFHVVRPSETWINEHELNKFEEAIMICRSR
jgi:hypothetical protein